ncbi:MAG: SDR family oxidoreductase [Cytophagales bacterium]|nr:SDR family oxidoreductase [Cytophagales bacterium]
MKNKVVIITGGSSGIGKGCAVKFGEAGAKIVITGRNEQRLKEVSAELTEKGILNLSVAAEASLEEDNKKVITKTIETFGSIDVLINNAGMSMRALFENIDLAVIKKLMNVNFYGTVYATKYALPHIIKSKGSIIGISSIAGFRGLPGRTGYSASKFAMQGFLDALRTELLKKEVHVLVVCPGYTNTNIRNTALSADGTQQSESPLDESKLMSSLEVASHILKATKKRKRDLVLTTQGKLTFFMNKWFPSFMDRKVLHHLAKEKDSPFGN